ncbi:MAG: HPP family protein [Bacteroidia bacterium]
MNLSDSITSLMSKNVKTIQANDTLLKVKHFFEAKDFHHHLPVMDGDKVVGMVSLYDFLIAKKAATLNDDDPIYNSVLVKDFMRTHLKCVTENDTIKHALTMFIEHSIQALPVISNGKLIGIVTSNDILRALLKES